VPDLLAQLVEPVDHGGVVLRPQVVREAGGFGDVRAHYRGGIPGRGDRADTPFLTDRGGGHAEPMLGYLRVPSVNGELLALGVTHRPHHRVVLGFSDAGGVFGVAVGGAAAALTLLGQALTEHVQQLGHGHDVVPRQMQLGNFGLGHLRGPLRGGSTVGSRVAPG